MLYQPEAFSYSTPEELASYLQKEIARIGVAMENLQEQLALIKTEVPPGRPRDGMIRYADGTSWNPGAGQGIYAFYAGVWNKL